MVSKHASGVSYPRPTLDGVKLLHTSDWHVGRTIRGRSRDDEHRQVLVEIVELAGAHGVDAVLVAGDLFDSASPTPASEAIVYRALLDLSRVAPVVIVAGNHDHPRRLEAVAPLLELGRVVVGSTLRRPEDGGVVRLPGTPLRLGLIPFQSQRGIVTADDLMALDPHEHGGRYARRMAAVIERLCERLVTDEVNLVMGHLMVSGASTGGGERMSQVIDYSIPAQSFPPELSYVALGHLHRAQRVPAPAPVWYSGSPLQLDFGETADRKAVLVVEIEPGLPAAVREIPIVSGRRLRMLAGTLDDIAGQGTDLGDDYVKVVVDEPARVGLADDVRRLVPNAVDVVVDPRRRPNGPTEAPRRLGRSHRDLFVEYLRERDAFDERLVVLFDELEATAHEA